MSVEMKEPSESDLIRVAIAQAATGSKRRRLLAAGLQFVRKLEGYEPVCVVHRGGQGVVFEAVQRSTGRRVAIKILRHGVFASPAEHSRLQREVQILGQLQHANIVTIHDSGQLDGSPYIVMDFIDGQPLDVYVAYEQPPTEALIGLFIRIADAVQAAHVRGVIHRDLKPANILIDAQGEPHIVDFGLATVSADESRFTAVTQTGQILGSLPWSAPEQARGDHMAVDVRTDVYSLGVILYQVVTGNFPYDVTGSPQQLMHTIASAVPVRPRIYCPDSDLDLETIILRCLAKEPQRRYQSAGALGRDLEHYLAGEAIDARRDSNWYVFRKSVKQNRGPLIAAGLVVVSLIAGLVVSLTLWRRSERELVRTTEIKNVLFQIFGGVDPAVSQGRDTSLLRELMEAAEQRITSDMDPIVEADVRSVLGIVYSNIDLREKADTNYGRSIELRRQVLGDSHPDTIEVLHHLGKLRVDEGRYGEAEALIREALKATRLRYGEKHRNTLNCLNDLALVLGRLGNVDECIELLFQVADGYRDVLGNDHQDTLSAILNLASQLRQNAKPKEAESFYREAYEGFLRTLGDNHPLTLSATNGMGALMNSLGRPEEAKVYYQAAHEQRLRTLGPHHTETIRSINNLSAVLIDLGQTDEAGDLLREGLATARERLAGQWLLGAYLTKLGLVQIREGAYEQAEKTLNEAIPVLVAQLGERHAQTRKTYMALIQLYTSWHAESRIEAHQALAESWQAKYDETGR